MDGNGRWAKQRGRERVFGHAEGIESVRAVTEACVEYGVKYLSVFAFSEENWNRPEQEVGTIMSLMFKAIKNELSNFMKNGVRFRVLGNRARISSSLEKEICQMEQATAANEVLTVIVFLSYSGKWDILQAAQKMALEMGPEAMQNATLDDFSKYLVTSGVPDPDLIIRTSGEQRISNYLLWQGAYSEFYFTDVLWPDFRKAEFKAALDEYAQRDRRYGKVK